MSLVVSKEAEGRAILENIDAIPGMTDVERKLRSIIDEAEGTVKDMCLALLNSGGKRLRPLMVILSGLCFSDISPDIINSAVAAEFVHMASLIHDDVIDKSDFRRGKETVNSLYGDHPAVLAGDFLFAKAFAILSGQRLIRSMEYIVDAIVQMCSGEINQMNNCFNTNTGIEDYFKRISKKTGILISSCCRAGAAAAGADEKSLNIMSTYGMNIGYAFQIIDDILDFKGDSTILGKPTGKDLLNGNITLPLIFLLNDEYYGSHIRKIVKSGIITEDVFAYINRLLDATGAVERSYCTAESCINKAKACIKGIPDTVYKSCLVQIADKILKRIC